MKDMIIAVKMNALFVFVTGVIFPVVVWAISQVFLPYTANGSLLKNKDGIILGSALIGQQFTQAKYFHGRPSAAGSGYDASNSGGTNLGPTSAKLFTGVKDDPATPLDESFEGVAKLAADYRKENNVSDFTLLPVDAVTRSGSGLDPDISPANALMQASRVATARGTNVDIIKKLITESTEGRYIGIYGEPRVNVLALNLLLDQHSKR